LNSTYYYSQFISLRDSQRLDGHRWNQHLAIENDHCLVFFLLRAAVCSFTSFFRSTDVAFSSSSVNTVDTPIGLFFESDNFHFPPCLQSNGPTMHYVNVCVKLPRSSMDVMHYLFLVHRVPIQIASQFLHLSTLSLHSFSCIVVHRSVAFGL